MFLSELRPLSKDLHCHSEQQDVLITAVPSEPPGSDSRLPNQTGDPAVATSPPYQKWKKRSRDSCMSVFPRGKRLKVQLVSRRRAHR